MDRDYCEHGLAERRRTASVSVSSLLISPNNMATFQNAPTRVMTLGKAVGNT
jgi:hypothetical protein